MGAFLLVLACTSIDPRADVLIVDGTLGGKPVRVFVDTGGSGGLSPAFAKKHKPIPGQMARFAGASGKWRESPIYDVAGLRIGNTEIPRFPAIALPLREGPKYDVVIGLRELGKFVVDIDLDQNRFCLRDDAPPVALEPYQRKDDGVIVIPATLGERRFEHFIFDTGAGVTVLTDRFLPQIPHRKRPEKVISLDGSGVHQKQYFVEIDRICFLDRCKPRQIVMPDRDISELNGFPVDGILGMSFLKGYRITLDLPRGRIGIG